ncbi:MAG: hypothetical protein EPN79_11920 [Burkholderiaceae bacterium]|nr:MAG: hypothetical protein EPN79_11920 [Burkholderiaceae bacterium]TBR76869.1 MAG: hypothetical protein EPN64_06510 [Burkholderiaceae bacterium]
MALTEKNGLDVKLIAPKFGAKFSPNLYRWLKKKGREHRAWTSRLFRDTNGELWIGTYSPEQRELIGARLIAVLCNGTEEDSAAWQRVDAVEVEGFWERYVAKGRCAIDDGHTMNFKGDDARWSVKGDTRSCLWCGKANQVMKRWTETVQRAQWVVA